MKLRVVPTRKAKRKLRRNGKLRVTANFTFTPIGGTANTEPKAIRLIRKR